MMNSPSAIKHRDVHIHVNGVTLTGIIQFIDTIKGVVIFSHGVSSSRFNPVNRHIADELTEAGLACVLIDLLTPGERALLKQSGTRSGIDLIASRLIRTLKWIKGDETFNPVPKGIFGTNLSAVAAMIAAIECADIVDTLVLSNVRPELMHEYLPKLVTPTLLIAGEKDRSEIQENHDTLQALSTRHRLEIISRITPDTHNPEIVEQITIRARRWLLQQFQPD